jgi:hypothetical protein
MANMAATNGGIAAKGRIQRGSPVQNFFTRDQADLPVVAESPVVVDPESGDG